MSPLSRLMTGASLAAMLAASAALAADAPAADATAPSVGGTDDTTLAQNDAQPRVGAQGGGQAEAQQRPAIQQAALEAESQTVEDGQVTIDMAWMPEAGFVALHAVQDGKLSADAIGYAPLAQGDNEGIAIKLGDDVSEATTVVAMLHRDTGQVGTYEFGMQAMDRDQPELISGRPIAAKGVLPSETPAAEESGDS